MATVMFKQEVMNLVESLPDEAGWAELAELIDEIRDIEAGLADAAAGRTISQEELERQFGIE